MSTPTTRLPQQHRLAAVLIAEGKLSMKEISERVNMPLSRLRTLKNSPLFQEMVGVVEDKVVESGIQKVVEDLMDDAPQNLSFVKDVRDGKHDDVVPATMGNRLRASDMLMKRQLPVITAEEDGGAKIILPAGLVQQMMGALTGAGIKPPIDVTPEPTKQAEDSANVARELTASEAQKAADK